MHTHGKKAGNNRQHLPCGSELSLSFSLSVSVSRLWIRTLVLFGFALMTCETVGVCGRA